MKIKYLKEIRNLVANVAYCIEIKMGTALSHHRFRLIELTSSGMNGMQCIIRCHDHVGEVLSKTPHFINGL